MTLRTRNELPNLLNRIGLRGEAAFIGVAEAYFEIAFMEAWPGKATLIDVWKILNVPGYSGHGEADDAGQEARYQRVLEKARKFGGRCQVMRATSEQAAPTFKDSSLDFCYLDAAHDFDSISADIKLWAPKMKPNSVFAGHDYLSGPVHGGSQVYGVKDAVDAFAAERGLTVNVIPEEWPSWFIKL